MSTPSPGKCRSGCPTQDHASWGACARDMNLRIAYANSANGQDLTRQKKWDKELADYRSAVSQGIQPASTKRAAIDHAVKVSDLTGKPFQG